MYVHRGLLVYLNSKAELACVIGHEIGHDVARHPARREARNLMLGVGDRDRHPHRSPTLAEMSDVGAARPDAGLRARPGIRRPTASASSLSVEKFKKEQQRLLKAMYPKAEPKPGELFKIVQ